MAASAFDLEQARLAAARSLPAECFDDFARLSRTLIHGPPFQWLLVDAPDERLREQVIGALEEVLGKAGLTSNKLPLSERIGDVAELERRLIKNANAAAVVHVIGRPDWFNASRWQDFNARRERLAAQARARLIFWLDREAISLASSGAPDLWAWRGRYLFISWQGNRQSGRAAEAGRAQTSRRGADRFHRQPIDGRAQSACCRTAKLADPSACTAGRNDGRPGRRTGSATLRSRRLRWRIGALANIRIATASPAWR